jgi:hypothetical protein
MPAHTQIPGTPTFAICHRTQDMTIEKVSMTPNHAVEATAPRADSLVDFFFFMGSCLHSRRRRQGAVPHLFRYASRSHHFGGSAEKMLLVRWLPIMFSVTVRDSTRIRPVTSTRSRSSIESSDVTRHTSTSWNDAGDSGMSQCCGGKSLHLSLSRHVHGRDVEKHNPSLEATARAVAVSGVGFCSSVSFIF